MTKRRRRINWFWVTVVAGLVFGTSYFGRNVAPELQNPFVPTATPTRAPESFVSEAEAYFEEGK